MFEVVRRKMLTHSMHVGVCVCVCLSTGQEDRELSTCDPPRRPQQARDWTIVGWWLWRSGWLRATAGQAEHGLGVPAVGTAWGVHGSGSAVVHTPDKASDSIIRLHL